MQCTSCGTEAGPSSRFCPTCGSPVSTASTPEIHAKTSEKSVERRVAFILFPVLLIGGGLLFVQYLNPSVNAVIKDQPVITAPVEYDSNFVMMTTIESRVDGGDIVFSLDDVKRHRLVRFEYTGGKTPRQIMAYVSPTGQLVTAISLSEHCGSTEFKLKQKNIYCTHCPSNWDMMTLEAFGCCAKYFPDPIPSRVNADEVHLPKTFVDKWAGRM